MVEYDARRWLGILFRLHGAVLPRLLVRIALLAAVGALAALLFEQRGIYVPPLGHTLVGVALGLLLVFRTNTAYDRYWEGRRQFATLVHRSRDFARQVASYIADPADRAELVRHLQLAFALIRQHVRRDDDLGALGALATTAERAALRAVGCRPNLALRWISDRLAERANVQQLVEGRLRMLDQHLSAYAECLAAIERIATTPMPFAYAHHLKAFLVLFCLSVPFALSPAMGWYTPLAAAIVGFALFGIDEIGVEIEDPFGRDANDLPLDALGELVNRDTAELLTAPVSTSS